MVANSTGLEATTQPAPQASKPLIVIACSTAYGHTSPLLPHATNLTKNGFDVSFIGGPEFEDMIRKTGATFYATENTYTPENLRIDPSIPEGPPRLMWAFKRHFIDTTPLRMKTLQDVLEGLREKHPGREVIVVQELMYMGTWPFLLGATPPKGYDQFPKVINFSPAPLVLSSVDTAPFGPGLPPDSSVEGRARNAAMYASMKDLLADLTDYGNTVYGRLGATEKATGSLFDLWTTAGDITLQPCSPSLEYPRNDLPSTIRFIGGTPPNKVSLSTSLPPWWGELEINKQASNPKKVVFITQGTVAIDYDMLLIPAIQALADRDDVFVIAVLGAKGAKLDGFEVPENAKVVDYLSYDVVLTYADVFVTNGGYGSFMHGVMHGVPMVMAGTTQDKAEVSMRGEWAGIAVNLRTDTPSREALRDGVDRILADSKFKIRCSEIQQENEELNCIAQFEKIITEME